MVRANLGVVHNSCWNDCVDHGACENDFDACWNERGDVVGANADAIAADAVSTLTSA